METYILQAMSSAIPNGWTFRGSEMQIAFIMPDVSGI